MREIKVKITIDFHNSLTLMDFQIHLQYVYFQFIRMDQDPI